MKNYISIYFLVFCSFIFGQTIDPSAKKILDDIRKSYESKSNSQIKFKYLLSNPKQKINQQENGVIYSQGNKYNLTILGVNQIFDGNKLYQISNEDQEVTISKSNSDDIITPTKIFDIYKTGYSISKPTKNKVANFVTIKLIPTNPKNKSKEIILTLDTQKKSLVQMIENNKDGSVVTLKVISYDSTTKLNPALFTFDKNKYKGYVITDLN